MGVPNRIGRFEVEERIGAGAFASVWRARDEALDALVAIKVLSENWTDALDVRRRFLAEARMLRRADSDRVVRVHDLGELADGRPYLVMTHADRGTLAGRFTGRPMPWRVAVGIAVEIGRALQVLHGVGVLHRDLKPSNVLFRSTPGGEQVMLGDLGLGKLLSEASMLTMAVGTPAFMAPEQAMSGEPLSVRTDLYGLGAVLYLLLTGGSPHADDGLAEIGRYDRPPPPPPSRTARDLPRGLDAVVLRAIAPRPELRYATADDLVTDLLTVLDGATPAAVVDPVPAAGRAPQARRRWPVLAVVAVLLLAGVGVGGYLWWRQGPGAPKVTEEPVAGGVKVSTGELAVTVPADWVQHKRADGWDPRAFDPAWTGIRPGLLVGTAINEHGRLEGNARGVFIGVLPEGVPGKEFGWRVPRPSACRPAKAPARPPGVTAIAALTCGDTSVVNAVRKHGRTSAWVQITEARDRDHAEVILASVELR